MFMKLICALVSLGLLMQTEQALCLSASYPKTDSLLLAQIQDQIKRDPILAGLPVQVEVNNAAVKLSGRVEKKDQAISLIILAEATAGVGYVEVSGLTLQRGRLTSDDLINALVIGLFNREGLMGPLSQLPITTTHTGIATATYETPAPPINIEVKTKDGVVYLSGSAPNQAAIDKATKLAGSINGVREVRSTIKNNQ